MTPIIHSPDPVVGEMWEAPPSVVQPPAPDEIHVWCAGVHVSDAWRDRFQRMLSNGEAQRAGRLVREADRRRFIVARGLLRWILSVYLKTDPGELRFESNAYGKPRLAGTDGPERLSFNVSYSGDRVLCAFARRREVGVDIEKISPAKNLHAIVKRFFSPREVEAFESLPDPSRTAAYFNCWTRKEAYMKACGKGLSMELNTFSVSLAEDKTEEIAQDLNDDQETKRIFTIRGIPSVSGYAGAVAAQGRNLEYRFWDWGNHGP